MKTIGIDYQQTLSMLCLGEGQGASARVRGIGDGLRPLIPNAVQGDDLWGSRALGAEGKAPSEPNDGPWLAEPESSLFWGHLYKRVYAFLGRIAPTSQNGYQAIAGVQAANYAAAAAGMKRLCEQSGFGALTCIPATDATLARFLAEQGAMGQGETTLAVVVAGDTATSVSAYKIRYEAGAPPRIVARDSVARTLPVGQAHWTGRLLIHVNDLFSEPIRSGYELALRDAALEFGARLRRAPNGRPVAWGGPLRDKMYSPLQLTPEDCRAWPEAMRLLTGLPELIRDSLATLGGKGRPDLILVGGVGALWPFAVEAASGIGRVQQTDTPEEDVARGAAWWPEVETFWGDALPGEQLGASAPLPDWLSGLSDTSLPAKTFAGIDDYDFSASTPSTPLSVTPTVSTEATLATEPWSPFATDPSLETFSTPLNNPFLRDEDDDIAGFTPSAPSAPVRPETPVVPPSVPKTPAITSIPSTPTAPSSSPYDFSTPQKAVVKQEKATDVSSKTSASTPAKPVFDIPAAMPTTNADEEDLDALPPWDPRRNDL